MSFFKRLPLNGIFHKIASIPSAAINIGVLLMMMATPKPNLLYVARCYHHDSPSEIVLRRHTIINEVFNRVSFDSSPDLLRSFLLYQSRNIVLSRKHHDKTAYAANFIIVTEMILSKRAAQKDCRPGIDSHYGDAAMGRFRRRRCISCRAPMLP